MLAAWLKNHFETVWWCVFLACAAPAVYMIAMVLQDGLGPNPLAFLLHTSGRSALIVLTVTLAITPLRRWTTNLSKITHGRYGKRLADWNWMIRLRRQLGMWCFSYAVLHAWLYLAYDAAYDWGSLWTDFGEKPYLMAGAAGLTMLVPLAATSSNTMMRRLGRNWRRLHMLTYAVAVVGLLHFWWMMKPGLWTPWPETAALTILLGYRLLLRTGLFARWDGFDGSESSERSVAAKAQQVKPNS